MDDRPEILDPREQRLNDVLGAYLEAHDAGWAPAQAALLTRYPEFKSELEAFFVAQSRVAALAYPCPASAQRQGRDADGAPSADRFERNPASGYETLEWIGGGGMGDVFKARQKAAGRWVALKKIKPGRFTPREVRRFLVEAQAAANLDHPNIVPIFDVGEENGQPFYSMKLVEHGTLQEHLARFQQSHRAAARLLAKVARAMHHAHQFGIVHRDLKPANILLDAQEHPYVADFGLAKRLGPASAGAPPVPAAGAAKAPTARERKTEAAGRDDEDAAQTGPTQALGDGAGQTLDRTATADAPQKTATRRGTFVGTIGYAAPENADVSGDATSTVADVYSLGAVLYKLLTGVTLFEANSVAEYARQVKECAPKAPRALNTQVDEKLEAICLKCLAKNPENRYHSAEALAEDLERWLRGEAPEAWPLPRRIRAWRAVRRYLFVTALATLLGFGAAAIFFVYYYFDPDRVPRELEQEARQWPVTLLGETGVPRWSRWNVGAGTVLVSPNDDQPFSFATAEHGRLELMPKAPGPHFRLTAEVRHDEAFQGWGMAGIYFAHFERKEGDDAKRYWCDFTFADCGRKSHEHIGPNQLTQWSAAELWLQRYSLPRGFSRRATETRELFEAAQTTGKKPDWRKLSVEVTAEQVQLSWDGKPLKAMTRAELRGLNQTITINGEVVIPEYEFIPDGALGLYVYNSKASFRNVIIESLK